MSKYYCPNCGYNFTKEEHRKTRKLAYPMVCIKCHKDFRAFEITDKITNRGGDENKNTKSKDLQS